MKNIIIGLIVFGLGITAYAWVEPLQIYEIFAQIPQEKADIYKVVDGKTTCYVLAAPVVRNSSAKNQTISCVVTE